MPPMKCIIQCSKRYIPPMQLSLSKLHQLSFRRLQVGGLCGFCNCDYQVSFCSSSPSKYKRMIIGINLACQRNPRCCHGRLKWPPTSIYICVQSDHALHFQNFEVLNFNFYAINNNVGLWNLNKRLMKNVLLKIIWQWQSPLWIQNNEFRKTPEM